MVVPAEMPVTIPVEETVAIAGLELYQVVEFNTAGNTIPGFPISVDVLFTHAELVPEIVGLSFGFTVIVNVSFIPRQPLAVGVIINVSMEIPIPIEPIKLAILPGLVDVLPMLGPNSAHV